MASTPTRLSRAVQLLLAGVIALAFVGFVVGIRQGKTVPDLSPPPREQFAEQQDAIPATAWRDFDRRLYGPNRQWKNTLASLQPLPQAAEEWAVASDADRRALQTTRATRRAFPGAPPVVPHPIDQMSTSSCMVCHAEGLSIGKGVHAPKMSHAILTNCTQCHVEIESPDLAETATGQGAISEIANTFEKVEMKVSGDRAWPGAPPSIPHPTWMREQCASCHGPTGPAAIRTSHPTRVNCRQCHPQSAVLDQVAVEDQPGFLSSQEAVDAGSRQP